MTGSVGARLKGLWIVRSLPFPMNAGDRIYSGNLIGALAHTGADLTVVGFSAQPREALPAAWPVRWIEVPGAARGTARSLASLMPLVAASHATPAFRRAIDTLAREPWDFVVFDHYAFGWALEPFLRKAVPSSGARPLLVHVAHDHEASVYASMVRNFQGSNVKRLGVRQNAWKVARIERHMARTVDLITTITPEDADRFARDAPHTANVTLTPGFGGAVAAARVIDERVPRRVVMVGNYTWIAKAENLRQFVAAADAVFHAHGIELHVFGTMGDGQAAEIRANARATIVHGFVDDVLPHFASARMAVIPEVIGGGFKLKNLDYIFGRMPVATLAHAMAGLPDTIRRAMLSRDDLPSLVQALVQHIDDFSTLNAMQATAFDAAQLEYRWEDRGRALAEAIGMLRGCPASQRVAMPAQPSMST